MIRAYHKTHFHFYQYFKAQAIRRAENGTPAEVARALATPALYLPLLLFPEIVRRHPPARRPARRRPPLARREEGLRGGRSPALTRETRRA